METALPVGYDAFVGSSRTQGEHVERAGPAGTGWSVRLVTVIGIPIRVHFTFLLLVVYIGFAAASTGSNVAAAVVFIILLFACVVLHELGHASMARGFGVRTQEIVLYPIGGIARLENIPPGIAEVLIALSGPAVNLVLAAALFALMVATGTPLVEPFGPGGIPSASTLLPALLYANGLLFLFNLIPAFPMDGGRVLRGVLSLRLPDERATDIAAAVGQAIAILFGAWGLFQSNYILLFIALFVFLGAGHEAAFHRRRAAVLGRTAAEAMMTRFETLAPQDSLERATEHLLATTQQDFPVVDAWSRVVGVLPRAILLKRLAQRGSSAAVLEVMEREFQTIAPGADLEQALRMLQSSPGTPVIVLEDERLVGMITLENLAEFIEVARAGGLGPVNG